MPKMMPRRNDIKGLHVTGCVQGQHQGDPALDAGDLDKANLTLPSAVRARAPALSSPAK